LSEEGLGSAANHWKKEKADKRGFTHLITVTAAQ